MPASRAESITLATGFTVDLLLALRITKQWPVGPPIYHLKDSADFFNCILIVLSVAFNWSRALNKN